MMRLNHLVNICDQEWSEALAFASSSVQGREDEYFRRGSPRRKILEDIFMGTMGEFAFRAWASGSFEVSDPDLNVYEKGKKSWAPDLTLDGLARIHVKTCDQYRRDFPESYGFQIWDKEVFERYSDMDLFGFVCRVDENEWLVRFFGSIALLHARKLFQLPQKRSLKAKRFVYASSLDSLADVQEAS